MERDEETGFEIMVIGRRWEVFDADGNLWAEGRGGIQQAREWIEQRSRRIDELLGIAPAVLH